MSAGNWSGRLPPARRHIPYRDDWLPAQTALSRYPAPSHAVPVVPCAAVIRQPAPRIARDPGVAPARIVRPIAIAVRIPSIRLISWHPDIPVAFDRIPVSIVVQVIPTWFVGGAALFTSAGLLLGFLRDLVVSILVPLVPGVALDGGCGYVRSVVCIEVQAFALFHCLIERSTCRGANSAGKDGKVGRVVETDSKDRVRDR